MEQEDKRAVHKCFGSAVVGPRGQLVIPVEARRELGIGVGTKLLAFNLPQGEGLLFVKVEAVEDLITMMSLQVKDFTKLLREAETANIEHAGN
ncbi:MAG: AbrB/MazE/SpoVT family DNA-binding domain-containing protein [Dehalococcoidia bacterium]|nr:AbrB/MazE/SpoVT family DNA-binding domain-containing protein [Dehalococcoidia bacterium]